MEEPLVIPTVIPTPSVSSKVWNLFFRLLCMAFPPFLLLYGQENAAALRDAGKKAGELRNIDLYGDPAVRASLWGYKSEYNWRLALMMWTLIPYIILVSLGLFGAAEVTLLSTVFIAFGLMAIASFTAGFIRGVFGVMQEAYDLTRIRFRVLSIFLFSLIFAVGAGVATAYLSSHPTVVTVILSSLAGVALPWLLVLPFALFAVNKKGELGKGLRMAFVEPLLGQDRNPGYSYVYSGKARIGSIFLLSLLIPVSLFRKIELMLFNKNAPARKYLAVDMVFQIVMILAVAIAYAWFMRGGNNPFLALPHFGPLVTVLVGMLLVNAGALVGGLFAVPVKAMMKSDNFPARDAIFYFASLCLTGYVTWQLVEYTVYGPEALNYHQLFSFFGAIGGTPAPAAIVGFSLLVLTVAAVLSFLPHWLPIKDQPFVDPRTQDNPDLDPPSVPLLLMGGTSYDHFPAEKPLPAERKRANDGSMWNQGGHGAGNTAAHILAQHTEDPQP